MNFEYLACKCRKPDATSSESMEHTKIQVNEPLTMAHTHTQETHEC